jgi:UDPglucose 6-dehydrogenase
VQAYDPAANQEALHFFEIDFKNDEQGFMKVTCGKSMQSVLKDADALVIVTEWKEFRSPDFALLKQELKDPIIFDGRNLYEPKDMRSLGFEYYGIGRGSDSSRKKTL